MTRISFICLFILVCFSSIVLGQKLSISNIRMQMLYAGLENDISVAVENTPCTALVLKTTNGTITGEGCSYKIVPAQIGKAEIIVYKKEKGNLIEVGRNDFRVKLFDQELRLHLDNGHEVMKATEIAQQESVHLYQPGLDYDFEEIFSIEKFTIVIQHADTTIQPTFYLNNGKLLNPDIKKAFGLLSPGDSILFKEISILSKSGFRLAVNPITVTIIP